MKLKEIDKAKKECDRVLFEEISHKYLFNGKFLMGVTTLMEKHGIKKDYSGIPEKVLEAAAQRGTQVHRMLEDYDNNDPVVAGEFEKELKAYAKLGLKVMASEYLVSDKKVVASSIDKVLDIDEDNMVDIADVKTTSQLYIEDLEWQLGIYKYLFELQNRKIKVRKCWGIHVRNGKAVMREINPVSAEMVQELLKCEENGILYHKEEKPATGLIECFNGDVVSKYNSYVEVLKDLYQTVAFYEDAVQEIKDMIYVEMLEKNVDKSRCGNLEVALKRPYTKQSLDTKALKEKMPEVYQQFLKETTVKGNITIKQDVIQ